MHALPQEPAAEATSAAAAEETAVAAATAAEELIEQDLLVEDVSIDGMCGVY